jgi:hypothetical protein
MIFISCHIFQTGLEVHLYILAPVHQDLHLTSGQDIGCQCWENNKFMEIGAIWLIRDPTIIRHGR